MPAPKLSAPDSQDRSYPVQENMRVQRRHWRLERAGSAIVIAIVVMTLLGLFSKGPLSRSAAEDKSLHVEYERFQRNGALSEMTIDAVGEAGEPVRLDITGDLLDGVTLENINPEPVASANTAGTGISIFITADKNGHARAYLSLRADGIGLIHAHIETNRERVSFWQFIYP